MSTLRISQEAYVRYLSQPQHHDRDVKLIALRVKASQDKNIK